MGDTGMTQVQRAVLMEIMNAGNAGGGEVVSPPPGCALTIVSVSKEGWQAQASTHLFEGHDAGKSVKGETVPGELRNPPTMLGSVDGFVVAAWQEGEMSVVVTTDPKSRERPLTCLREAGRITNVLIANRSQTLLLLFPDSLKVIRGGNELLIWDTEVTLSMHLRVLDADMAAERVWAIVSLGENVWAVSAHDLYVGGTETVGRIPKPVNEYTRKIVARTKAAVCIATNAGTLWVVLTDDAGTVYFAQVSYLLGNENLHIEVPESVDNCIRRVASVVKGHNGTVMLQANCEGTLGTSRKGRYCAGIARRSDDRSLNYRWISPDQRHTTDVPDEAAAAFRSSMQDLLTANVFSLGTHGDNVSIVGQTASGVAMNLFAMDDQPSRHYVMRIADADADRVPVAACATVDCEAVAVLSSNVLGAAYRQAGRLQDEEMNGVIEQKSTDHDEPVFDLRRGLECFRDATMLRATMEALGPMTRGYGVGYVDKLLTRAGAWLLSMTSYRAKLIMAKKELRAAEAVNGDKDGIIAERDATIADHGQEVELLEAKNDALSKRLAAMTAVELFNEETVADAAAIDALRKQLDAAVEARASVQAAMSTLRNRHAVDTARLKREHKLELAEATAAAERKAEEAATAAAERVAGLEAEVAELRTKQERTAKKSGEVRQSKLSKAREEARRAGYDAAKAELGAGKATDAEVEALTAGFADERRRLRCQIAELKRTLDAKAAAKKWDSSYSALFKECEGLRARVVELEGMVFQTYNHWGLASTSEIAAAFAQTAKLEADRLANVAKLIDLERDHAGACETITMLREQLAAAAADPPTEPPAET